MHRKLVTPGLKHCMYGYIVSVYQLVHNLACHQLVATAVTCLIASCCACILCCYPFLMQPANRACTCLSGSIQLHKVSLLLKGCKGYLSCRSCQVKAELIPLVLCARHGTQQHLTYLLTTPTHFATCQCICGSTPHHGFTHVYLLRAPVVPGPQPT